MNSGRLVLDTNIVSYLMRGSRVANVYKPHLEGRLLAISFITVGEFYFGAEKARWGEKRRQRLEQTLRKFLVIPYDIEIARCYGRLVAERQMDRSMCGPSFCASRYTQLKALRRHQRARGHYGSVTLAELRILSHSSGEPEPYGMSCQRAIRTPGATRFCA